MKMKFPDVEVIMNTVFDDDDRIFNAIEAGATGYLLKKNSLSNILTSIRDVVAGGAPMSPSIARKVLEKSNSSQKDKSNNFGLTDRELLVLQQLAKGMRYKMVAEDCFISIETVRSYIKKIYTKLHVHSVTEAVHKVYIEKK